MLKIRCRGMYWINEPSVAGSCEQGNELSGSIDDECFLDQLRTVSIPSTFLLFMGFSFVSGSLHRLYHQSSENSHKHGYMCYSARTWSMSLREHMDIVGTSYSPCRGAETRLCSSMK
jgi:hypothetical protein